MYLKIRYCSGVDLNFCKFWVESRDLVWKLPQLLLNDSVFPCYSLESVPSRCFQCFLMYMSAVLTHSGCKCQYAVRLVLTPILKIWKLFFSFTHKLFLKSILKIEVLSTLSTVFSFWNAFLDWDWYLCVFDKWWLCLLSCCSVVLPIFHMADEWGSLSLLCSKAWLKNCFHFQTEPIFLSQSGLVNLLN